MAQKKIGPVDRKKLNQLRDKLVATLAEVEEHKTHIRELNSTKSEIFKEMKEILGEKDNSDFKARDIIEALQEETT